MFSTRRIIAVRRRHDYDTGQQCAVPSQSNWIREDTNGLYALTVQALDGPAFLGLSGVGIAVEGFSSSRNASVEGHGDHGPGVLGFCFNSFGAGGQSGSAAVLPLGGGGAEFQICRVQNGSDNGTGGRGDSAKMSACVAEVYVSETWYGRRCQFSRVDGRYSRWSPG